LRSSIPVQWTGVYAALREFCNFEVRKTRRLAFNPVYAVELEPEVTPEARRWSASEARAFLAFTKDDPLGPLFRIVLLRGARRGEAAGLRWADGPHPEGAPHGAAQGAADGGESWQDNDLIFCQGDGAPYKPDGRKCPGRTTPAVSAGGGGGRESNPPATRHAALWF
jgi:hypothetical protein